VIQAFLDETGIHEQARICAIAGFIASVKQWQRFERLWDTLGPDAKDPGFHAKRFFARDPAGNRVRPYQDWTNERADKLLEGLVECVNRTDMHPIGAVVDVHAFRQYTLNQRRRLTGASWTLSGKLQTSGAPTKPYYLAFQSAIVQGLRRLKRLDWQVHFIFDQQNVLAPFALKLYNRFKTDPENKDWHRRMGDIAFRSREEAPALQLADLPAYSWYQIVLYGKAGVAKEVKYVLDSWADKNYELELFTIDAMNRLLSDKPQVKRRHYQV
jgi:hypothetical protein